MFDLIGGAFWECFLLGLWATKWLLKAAAFTVKYMAMSIISLFVGPGKTIHRIAAGRTERETGMPYEESPQRYNYYRSTATMALVFGWLVDGAVIALVLTQVLS